MEIEILLFIFTAYFTIKFLINWYKFINNVWQPRESAAIKYFFNLLPLVALVIYIITLKCFASYDVVDSFFYIFFYTLLGYVWLYFGLKVMARYLDLSWIDDVLNNNNKAALLAIIGGYIGMAVIYAGANVGDGPGWWCVIFAGGLGFIAWVILAMIVHLFTKAFERITVDRDISCGIRIGCYLLASGIILGRASAGDWTSVYMTVVEFGAGWPVLLLTLFAILVEFLYSRKLRSYPITAFDADSIFCGVVYVIIAVASVILIPLIKTV